MGLDMGLKTVQDIWPGCGAHEISIGKARGVSDEVGVGIHKTRVDKTLAQINLKRGTVFIEDGSFRAHLEYSAVFHSDG
jgi:hypothetical protein